MPGGPRYGVVLQRTQRDIAALDHRENATSDNSHTSCLATGVEHEYGVGCILCSLGS